MNTLSSSRHFFDLGAFVAPPSWSDASVQIAYLRSVIGKGRLANAIHCSARSVNSTLSSFTTFCIKLSYMSLKLFGKISTPLSISEDLIQEAGEVTARLNT
jgi:hypothetical protein